MNYPFRGIRGGKKEIKEKRKKLNGDCNIIGHTQSISGSISGCLGSSTVPTKRKNQKYRRTLTTRALQQFTRFAARSHTRRSIRLLCRLSLVRLPLSRFYGSNKKKKKQLDRISGETGFRLISARLVAISAGKFINRTKKMRFRLFWL